MIKFYTTILLLFSPLLLLSQSERDEKIRKRSERNAPTTNYVESTPVFVPTPVQSPVFYPNNYYSSWNPYVPYRTRNDNGIFNRRNSNSQTERNSKPLKVNLGFTFSPNKPSSVGLYGTLGRETFIYLSYEGSSKSEYEHYYNITFEEVMSWGDEQIDTFEEYSSFSIGVGGKVFNSLSHFAGINLSTKKTDLVFYDEFLVLSSNGEYSITDKVEEDFNLMYGLLYNYEKVTFGSSVYFLGGTRFNLSIGFNF
jgi:hypothetical protein